MDIKENLPTILSITSCAGVVGTGYAAVELGKEIERRKTEEKKSKKSLLIKAGITAGAGLLTIAGVLISNKLNKDKIEFTKKQMAETATALGVMTKLLRDYRAKVDPKEDKRIMSKIAAEHTDLPTIEKDGFIIKQNPDSDLMIWTDPFIGYLTEDIDQPEKKITYYYAREADILRAAMHLKDMIHQNGEAHLGTDFYDVLRECGVNLPDSIPGENEIFWEYNDEWFDYYGDCYFEFDWYTYENENRNEVNTLIFSDTVDAIHTNIRKIERWSLCNESNSQRASLPESVKQREK